MKLSEKIRILHTHQIIRSGGVEQRKLILFKELPKELFEQKIICTEAIGSKPEQYRHQGFEIIEVGKMKHPFDWNVHRNVAKIIKRFNPHIIHGTVYEGMSMAAINGFLYRVPKIILEETSYPIHRSWKANKLLKLYSLISDVVIGVSPAVVNYLLSTAHVNRSKVKLIMNGTTIPELSKNYLTKKKLKDRLNIPDNTLIIGSVGRMDNNIKGFTDLIMAMKQLRLLNFPVHLVIVGDGKLLQSYKKLVINLEIENSVTFTGYQQDVNPFYSVFDIFVLASYSEGFGLVIIEAWFHNLPVVASNVGGITYLIDHLKNGLLFNTRDINDLVQNLILLIQNPKLRLEIGMAGFLEAQSKYTAEIYASSVRNLYLKLLNLH